LWQQKSLRPAGAFFVEGPIHSETSLCIPELFDSTEKAAMSIELITLLMFGSFVVLLLLGVPISFVTGGLAVFFAFFLKGHSALYGLFGWIYDSMQNYALVAIPMFIFFAQILERSGITDALFKAVQAWIGSLRGSLALTSVVASTILAAMVGTLGAAVVSMSLIALPSMMNLRYDKSIALGSICAGGSLGLLIPPSVGLILYGTISSQSIGKLYMGGVFPGLLLSGLYIVYILIRSYINPDLCPLPPKEERVIALKDRILAMKGVILPILLIVIILGSIYSGVASVTESAGVGALGAVGCAAINRRLTWRNFVNATLGTLKITGMVMWIFFGVSAFVSIYQKLGGSDFVRDVIVGLPLGPWGTLILIQLFLIFLGTFIDPFGILLLTVPLFLPIIDALGFNQLWFAILFSVNMQIAFISPPFGAALFYLKGSAPPEITLGDIYRSVVPYVFLQVIGLVLCMVFPQIVLWLPSVTK
jgi:tripartite ATP-independent transporter DctM subunit